ncbi:hypothetical protein ACFX2J_002635 [Malus domestica]
MSLAPVNKNGRPSVQLTDDDRVGKKAFVFSGGKGSHDGERKHFSYVEDCSKYILLADEAFVNHGLRIQALKVPIDAEFNFSWLAALLALKVSMAYFHQTARDFVQLNVFLLVENVCLSHPMLLKSTWTRMEMHKDKVLFVSIESKDGAYAVLKLTPMLKKCGILAFSHRMGVFRKAYVHCIVFAKFEDDINLLADHMKDLFNSKTGRIRPKSADLGKVKEIFSKVRLVGCFGFPVIEYKGVRVSRLFPGSDGVPIKELLCGNRVAGWV